MTAWGKERPLKAKNSRQLSNLAESLPSSWMIGKTFFRSSPNSSDVTNVEQLVKAISSVATAGSTSGSTLSGLAASGLSSVSLRGLGEARTLVLVNGRRLATFAGSNGSTVAVDINAVPLAAIERVEVLRDGASSLYGSDAVAGVINFILRSDYTGLELSAQYGAPTRKGGGEVSKAGIVFGAGSIDKDRFNVMLAANVGKRVNRSTGGSATLPSQACGCLSSSPAPHRVGGSKASGPQTPRGTPLIANSNARDPATNPFGISTSGYGNPTASDPVTGTGQVGPNSCADINMFQAPTKGGVGNAFNNCLYDPSPDVGLFPKNNHVDVVGAFKFQINPNMTAYADLMWARNKIDLTYQPSPLRAGFFTTDPLFFEPATNPNNVQPALLIRPSNPAYQSVLVPYLTANGLGAIIGQDIAVTSRTFILGGRREIDTNTQTRLVTGLKGAFGEWDYDVDCRATRASRRGNSSTATSRC